jgi:lipid-A-disaccharide synthase
LFTAFEFSGDEHAAPVIAQLKKVRPEIPIYALGGPRMAAAGAELIERTTDKAAMLHNAAAQALEHKRRLGRLRAWLEGRQIAALVPVDSPAANWSICALVRRQQPPESQARIIHLVAPQLWAWGGWRIGKLRRLTDHVLCLLPFEPAWFAARGVAASFVGHPAFAGEFAETPDPRTLEGALPGHPRLALLPGSRRGEITANWPTMLEVFQRLRTKHPTLTGAVAAVDENIARQVREISAARVGGMPGLEVRIAETPTVLAWCDAALVTSGTATLHVAVRGKPMVVIYNISRLGWNILGRWIVRTRTFTLPNLLAPGAPSTGGQAASGTHVVPEFVPHFRQVEPVLAAMDRLLADPSAGAAQRAAFARIAEQFRGHDFAVEAAAKILEVGELR